MIKAIAWLVLIVQTVNMVNVVLHGGPSYGMGHGVGFDNFLAGMRDPWQNFIDSDLVMGLLFSMAWLVFRERKAPALQTIAWVWMTAWWGNIVIAVYVLTAAREAQGDWTVLLMGQANRNPARALPAPLRLLFMVAAVMVLIYLGHSLMACHFAAIPATGYLAGFLPVALTLSVLGGNTSRHR